MGIQLLVLLVGAFFSLATSPQAPCNFGVSPFSGQTGVPLDTVIRFKSPISLPRDLPAIGEDAAALYLLPEMKLIETGVEIDLETGAIFLLPKDPLLPDREYLAYGVRLEAIATPNYVISGHSSDVSASPTSAVFTTVSSVHAITLVSMSGQGKPEQVFVVFSQDMDTASFAGATVTYKEEGEVEIIHSASLIGPYRLDGIEYPHIMEFHLDSPGSWDGSLTISSSVLSKSGTALDGDGDGIGGEEEDAQVVTSGGGAGSWCTEPVTCLNGYVGESTCETY